MTINNNQLKAIIERIERLEAEKKVKSDDIKEIYAEAKGNGYDPKVIRAAVRRRKQDPNDLAEFEETLEMYLHALGELGETPLGQAAIDRRGRAA